MVSYMLANVVNRHDAQHMLWYHKSIKIDFSLKLFYTHHFFLLHPTNVLSYLSLQVCIGANNSSYNSITSKIIGLLNHVYE